jgi:hypothetical protein
MTMMNEVERLRADVQHIINENAAEIQITKKAYTDDGAGGKAEVITTATEFTGRIFSTAVKPAIDIIQPAGMQHRNEYKLVAAFDAEIAEVTENVKQTFTVDGITYLITELAIIKYAGSIVSKEAMLSKVS